MKQCAQIKGFTLIELLVVTVIIGIILTFATLGINHNSQSQHLQTEMERLSALLQLAGEEATLNAVELGIAFSDEGYQFFRLDAENWLPLSQDELLHNRKWPGDVQITLVLSAESLPLTEKADNPQILILSSGEWTPFELQVQSATDADVKYQLTGDLLGQVTWNEMEKY